MPKLPEIDPENPDKSTNLTDSDFLDIPDNEISPEIPERDLTEQQDNFAMQMANLDKEGKPNAAEAARNAGYSEKTARQQATQMLKLPAVQARIKAYKEGLARLAELEPAHVLGAMIELAFQDRAIIIKHAWNQITKQFDMIKLAKAGLANNIESIVNTPNKYGVKSEIKFYSRVDILKTLGEWLNIKAMPKETEEKIRKAVKAIVDYKERYPEQPLEKVINTFCRGRSVPAEIVREKVLLEIQEFKKTQ